MEVNSGIANMRRKEKKKRERKEKVRKYRGKL
jgi:hypothetical protein